MIYYYNNPVMLFKQKSFFLIKKNPAIGRVTILDNQDLNYTPITPSNQKITLTTNRDTPMNTNPIAACCKILKPFLYFPSSPAAVTIWKPPQSKITKATRAKIPSNRLMKLFATSISFPPCDVPVPEIPILLVAEASPNWVVTVWADVNMLHTLSIPRAKRDTTFNDNFFICFFIKKLKRNKLMV